MIFSFHSGLFGKTLLTASFLLSSGVSLWAASENVTIPATATAPAATSVPVTTTAVMTAPDTVVARINGVSVTNADLDVLSDLAPEFSRIPAESRRAALLTNVIEISLFAAEAEKKGFDQNPEFKQRVNFLRQRALYATFIDKEIAEKINEKEVRNFYDTEVATATPPDEIRARHILVKTKKEALAAIKKLESGKKFEDIAKQMSIDPSSSGKGGDLGYFARGYVIPEFESVAFELPVGKYSKKPIETKFGFHIVKVEDKRKQPLPTFEQAKPQIKSVLVRKEYLSRIKQMKAASKVDILDTDIKKTIEEGKKDLTSSPEQKTSVSEEKKSSK